MTNTPPPSSDAAAPTPGTCRWYSARWPSPTTSTTSTFWCSTRPTLAGIFNGSITRWDDPAITALNASMPPEDIKVIHRSDASGSTANFQAYLQAAAGGAWTQGTGKAFKGGVGTGAKGNEGTSAAVKNTEGAITYNELSFAMDEGLFAAEIKTPASRQSRRPVRIGTDSVGKTIAGAKIVGKGNDLVLDLSSFYVPTQDGVYPIVMATYEIVCSKYPEPPGRAGGQSGAAGDAWPRPDRPRQARLHPVTARLSSESLKRGRRHHLSQQADRSHIGIRCGWSRCPAIAASALPADSGGNTRGRRGASHP